ncbi:hypothetical protein [Pseudoalteromonas sp. SW0106-04]|uniref:hypothetical protein n=1 Tax=Pseudoalteromonas sp. SW0106-04 TaxID=1702169 RepID=UPI0006B5F985|nr:hypothetical protein [Pseudoalteromonas sp. SW0106-04]
MRWLALLLSVYTFYYLFSSISGYETANSDSADQLPEVKQIELPKPAPELEAEEQWLAYTKEPKKADKTNPKAKDPKKKEPGYPVLSVDGINYKLLGIFQDASSPFIVLKGPKPKPIKLGVGEKLKPGVYLKNVSSREILLSRGNQTITFNLFERSDNG